MDVLISIFKFNILLFIYLFIYLVLSFVFLLFYSWHMEARGLIGATAAGLRHSHSNVGSKRHLRPTPQFTAMLDP